MKHRFYSVALSYGPTSMPVNDLIPFISRSNHIDYSKVVICVRKRLLHKKLKNYVTVSNQKLYILELGILNFFGFALLFPRKRSSQSKIILHLHSPILSLAAGLKILSPNLDSIINLHNDWQNFTIIQKFSLSLGMLFCRRFITVSKYIFSTVPILIRWLTSLDKKTVSISNSINLDQFPGDINNKFEFRDIDVIIVGRLVPQKNWKKMIETLKLCKNVKSVAWFGTGYQKDKVKKLVSEDIGLNSIITFYGLKPRHEVLAAMSRSKVYLALSRWEGLGVANLEAIASGCYPVLSTIGPHIEMLNNLDLQVINDDKPEDVATAITKFISKKESFSVPLAQLMSYYSKNSMIENYETTLNEL